ncbi:hypothetical protein JOD31_001625 [Methylopila capsulata]|uniref:Uncharacterized protein n=1 Tax=Methylopila capsulata TaxID=61654 RepID=A0A9W6IRT2_9HYPH|nr:hypothetical protein [Methylopila capsulata]MBM7851400.1 hypothetical protein [Methylopila capsulata]GLK54457.1 hypothetical protein GCM10008170_04760 [Methylopila capsulata]
MNSELPPNAVEELAERLFARDHPVRTWRPQDPLAASAVVPDSAASPIELDLYRAFAARRWSEMAGDIAFRSGAPRRSRTASSGENG